MRNLVIYLLFISALLLTGVAAAENQPTAPEPATVSCNFADNTQITIRYNRVPFHKGQRLHDNRIWMPGGSAMVLFTGANLKFAGKEIPMGAYTLYLIPNKKNWTLIVSKNEKPESDYQSQEDVARGQMDLGQLSQPTGQLTLYFGQMGPKQCNLRVYYGETGAFTEFYQQ